MCIEGITVTHTGVVTGNTTTLRSPVLVTGRRVASSRYEAMSGQRKLHNIFQKIKKGKGKSVLGEKSARKKRIRAEVQEDRISRIYLLHSNHQANTGRSLQRVMMNWECPI